MLTTRLPGICYWRANPAALLQATSLSAHCSDHQTFSILYTSYDTSSYGCALWSTRVIACNHSRTRGAWRTKDHLLPSLKSGTGMRVNAYLFNESTAPVITSFPTHKTSTLVSDTLSNLPTAPILGTAPSPGKN